MENNKRELLLVVPIYNEGNILSPKLERLHDYLADSGINFHLVLSVDDSGDGSIVIAREFTKSHSKVDIIEHPRKMGRGYAVREAWSLFDADFYSFIDADLATGVEVIKALYNASVRNGADIFTASRFVAGASVSRPFLRNLVSRFYNSALRLMFNEEIRDHQCGFKIINSRARDFILNKTSENSWFWDTELLVLAVKSGLKVKEHPVDWIEEKYSRTPVKRLLQDVKLHGVGAAKLFLKSHNIRDENLTVQVHFEAGKESAK